MVPVTLPRYALFGRKLMMLSCFISLSRLYQGVQKIGHSRCRTRGGGVYWEEFYGYCFMFFSDRFVLFSDDCGAPPQYAIQRGGVCCRVFFVFFFTPLQNSEEYNVLKQTLETEILELQHTISHEHEKCVGGV